MVSFFFFHVPSFDCVADFRADTQPIKKPVRFPDAKFYVESFEQKLYLKTIIIPEAYRPSKLMVRFGPIWNIWANFGYGKGLLNFKKKLKIPYVSHFICLLIVICVLLAKLKKKMHACEATARGLLLEISYIPLLSVIRLHYHRLYQISSFESNFNLSLEDLKQLCGQKPPLQLYLPSPKATIK